MAIDFQIEGSKIIEGVMIVTPSIHFDERGSIWTSFIDEQINQLLPEGLCFKHDKFSKSKRNVLRGVHGDHKSWKLVTSVYGEILQVVVDLREGSPSYMKHEAFVINEQQQKLILIPPGIGNSYYAVESDVLYHYKLAYDGIYIDAEEQFTAKWDSLGIDWGGISPILSKRDSFDE